MLNENVNRIMNQNEDLHQKRMQICKQCGLYKESALGPMCNSKAYVKKYENDIKYHPEPGYVRGCGCLIDKKSRYPQSTCPAGKW